MRLKILAILLLLSSVASVAGGEVTFLSDPQTQRLLVPAYYWYYGCGPTAAGMMIGYWYGRGYENLIEGQPAQGTAADWENNKQRIKNMIASEGHIRDYYSEGYGVSGDDRVGTELDPLHEDDCVADYMLASRDPLINGVSFTAYIYRGLSGYAAWCGYPLSAGGIVPYDELQEKIISEIDAGRPMVLLVDTPHPDYKITDGRGDHYVVAMGYDDTGDTFRVAVHTGYDTNVYYEDEAHWLDFIPMTIGFEWGIGSGIWFNLFDAEQAAWGSGGDVDGDGLVGAGDIDLVNQVIRNEEYQTECDMNMDAVVNDVDVEMLISQLVHIDGPDGPRGSVVGDANVNGVVDIDDFIALKQHYGTVAGWGDGDFNGDGHVNLDDFVILKQNYGTSIVD